MAYDSGVEKITSDEAGARFAIRKIVEEGLNQHFSLSQEAFEKKAKEISRSCVLVRVATEMPFFPINTDLEITGEEYPLFSDIMQTILNTPIVMSRGSGFIADNNLIVTNYHVLKPRIEGNIEFPSSVSFYVDFSSQSKDHQVPIYESRSARIVSVDVAHDLAVLEFDGETPFSPLPIADSDALSGGESVIAMKNHWINTHTASPAFILGLDMEREVRGSDAGTISNFIGVATLSVEEGDSGSPLVDTEGRVVGVMTASEHQNQNMGFAVPARDVRALLAEAQEVRRCRAESEQAPVPTETPLEIPVTQH